MRFPNRVVAAVVAIAVGAGAFFLLVHAASVLGGWTSPFPGVPAVAHYLQTHTSTAELVRIVAVVAVVVGLVLLVTQLRRQDRSRRIRSETAGLHLAATRRARPGLRLAAAPTVAPENAGRGRRIPLSIGVDRVNRVLLVLFALVLVAVGAAALLAAAEVFGPAVQHQPLEPATVARAIAAQRRWLWWAVLGGTLVLLLLCLWWLLAQLRVHRVHRLALQHGTRVAAGALNGAVEQEILNIEGVDRASAFVRGHRRGARLVVSVRTEAGADLAAIRTALETEVVPHARLAAGTPDLPVRITIDQRPTPVDDRDDASADLGAADRDRELADAEAAGMAAGPDTEVVTGSGTSTGSENADTIELSPPAR